MVILASRTLTPALWDSKETFYKGKRVSLLRRQQVRAMGKFTRSLSARYGVTQSGSERSQQQEKDVQILLPECQEDASGKQICRLGLHNWQL